jgi:signal transduction histidine kinase/CheY-like chemotaxis protein
MQALTLDQCELLYPLAICFDLDNKIVGISNRIAAILGDRLVGRKLSAEFDIIRPRVPPDEVSLGDYAGRLILMVSKTRSFGFRGQVVPGIHRENQANIVVMSPWVTWLKENAVSYRPNNRDYSVLDSQLDLEIYLATQHAMILDMQEMSTSLRVTNQKLNQAMAIRTNFLSDVSHELRTPLTGIISALPLLQLHEFDEEGHALLQVMNASTRTLLDVINQVLDFNEVSEESEKIRNEPFSFYRLVIESLEVARLGAIGKNLKISHEVQELLISQIFNGDRIKLKRVLVNLLGNAVKYTSAGKIVLRADIVGHDDAVATVRIRVDDDGAGIDENLVGHLFDKYWKFTKQAGSEVQSSGLGLAITKFLVEALGGKVGYRRSDILAGSEFWVSLPMQQAEEASYKTLLDGQVNLTDKLEAGSLHGDVLLVDDNSVNLLVAKVILERVGLRVTTCGSAEEAISLSHNKRFSLIMMDILMPGMSGLDCSGKIRSTENPNQNTPIIAWSAHCSGEDMREFSRYGINDWQVKPPIPATFISLVKKWISV